MLLLVGSTALAVAGLAVRWVCGTRPRLGWWLAAAMQPAWAVYAALTGQWGLILSSLAYGVVYARNARIATTRGSADRPLRRTGRATPPAAGGSSSSRRWSHSRSWPRKCYPRRRAGKHLRKIGGTLMPAWTFGPPRDSTETVGDGTTLPGRYQDVLLDGVKVGYVEIHMHRRSGPDKLTDVSFGFTGVAYGPTDGGS